MATVKLKLQPHPSGLARHGAEAIYDSTTGKFSGKDAEKLTQIVKGQQEEGFAQPIPCFSIALPSVNTPLDLEQLAACLAPYWDISRSGFKIPIFDGDDIADMSHDDMSAVYPCDY